MSQWKTLGGQKKFMRDAETFAKDRYGHIDRDLPPRKDATPVDHAPRATDNEPDSEFA